MQRVFVLGLSIVVILCTAFAGFLVYSLLPHTIIIGMVATGVVITGLVCVGVLIIMFTMNQVVTWIAGWLHAFLSARIVVHDEVMVHVQKGGGFDYLSAEHWKAKTPLMLPAPQEEEDMHNQLDALDPRTQKILTAHDNGESNRQIAIALGIDRRKVAQVLNEWGKSGT